MRPGPRSSSSRSPPDTTAARAGVLGDVTSFPHAAEDIVDTVMTPSSRHASHVTMNSGELAFAGRMRSPNTIHIQRPTGQAVDLLLQTAVRLPLERRAHL